MPSGPEMDWRSDTLWMATWLTPTRCPCLDWQDNLQWLRTSFANGGYTVLPFTHCPWCGRIL
jgi:hypothetical protein